MRVILASASPRRRELLEAVGLRFEIMPSGVDEHDHDADGSRDTTVIRNASIKARDIADRVGDEALVIGADTLVFVDDHTLGKPESMDDARRMLRMMSGRTHQVLTGLSVIRSPDGPELVGHEVTDVTFRALSETDIARYLAKVDPHDRAGAYTVDGPGSLLVEKFGGCFYNVLGLPMVKLDSLLREFGVSLFD
jgi:septum formation protein